MRLSGRRGMDSLMMTLRLTRLLVITAVTISIVVTKAKERVKG